ncbi:hypothetical protein HW555_012826 [Spodoptera exigua]|uniref:PiggyBac transposable element-derived protein domain-containing protein n=1 Tax=Spodoptera exigua TaxID=7107 RepID=A0A835G6A6_SPOEX|nr:hypothetical protein HW555_012826 [Spodoptera exigua]
MKRGYILSNITLAQSTKTSLRGTDYWSEFSGNMASKSDSSDEEDNIPLSELSKARRTEIDDLPTTASSSAVDVPVTSCNTRQPTVQKTQKYTWQNRHTPKQYESWRDDQTPRNLQPPMYYFDLMFDIKIFEMLVHYTNIYAAQRNKTGNVSVSEMKCFIGILLFSGYVVVPRRSMYWGKSADSDYPLVYNALSRDPFNYIMSNLHSCDNTQIRGSNDNVILQFADVLQSNHPSMHFHLYFDNFFTSIPLLHELSNRGLKATRTIRENRTSKCPLPSNAFFKKTERGAFQFKSSRPSSILVCKWNDNSVVTVTSNVESVEPLQKAKRFSQEQKKYIHIDQPYLVKKYNENMGGIDRCDQNIGLYRTSIRGKKWYFPLFCHCLDMALHNAWQLYKHNGGQYDHLNFRRMVARGLLETYKKSEKRGPCPSPRNHKEASRYDRIDHLIEYKDTQLTCKVCKKKTNFICKKCNTYLHPKLCFITYHTSI